VQLVNIQWGPVSVQGNTATATTIESWRTVNRDGSTDDSRDRNVYTLVQDGGAWKIQSDQHPDDAQAPGGGASPSNPFAPTLPGGGVNPGRPDSPFSPGRNGTAPRVPGGQGSQSGQSGQAA